ncbi:M23 family metallopeptidase [Salinimicrobium xinjiangense]|uniref:M23 family metallopeptidase n=1 Tax=Salinimicrobium xinjiangense TaxID=438596 RepID=UPI000401F8B7|nr:M23 family metallopeptidase [Salinimicrobium xinjiangense]
MKQLLILLFLFISCYSTAQDIKFYHEKTNTGYRLFADNNEFAPVSMNMNFTLENLRLHGNDVVVLEPNKSKQSIGELRIIDRKKAYSFSVKRSFNFGDTFLEKYTENYEYLLPFPKDSSYLVIQGYNGNFSHQNKKAIDFRMPVGTPVLAAREGVVVQVVDANNKGCAGKECLEFNNFIKILHPDGTFAEYVHLKHQGVVVKKGDVVTKGQLIGYSGNTGWSSEPHLHFVVYLQQIFARTTLPTLFKTDKDLDPRILERGNIYMNAL